MHSQVGKIRKTAARKREYHILFMVLTTAACYLLCWMPYGVVAMMATFGPPNIISPVASVVPSLLAKSSTVINPLIYILMNKQVSRRPGHVQQLYLHGKKRPQNYNSWNHTNAPFKYLFFFFSSVVTREKSLAKSKSGRSTRRRAGGKWTSITVSIKDASFSCRGGNTYI